MSDISKEELKKEIAAILKDADLSSTSSKKVRQDIEAKLDIDLSSRRKEVDELVLDYIEQDKGKASKKNGNVEDEEEDEEEENDDEEEEEEDDDDEDKKPKRTSNAKKAPPVKRAKSASSEESEDGSEDEGDDEYSPKKSSKKQANKRGSAAGRKKKGGSDDDSDEDWGKGKKKRGGGASAASGAAAKKPAGAKRGGGGYTKAIKLSPELAALVGEDAMPRHEVVKRVWAIIKERNLYDPKNKQFAICDDELLKVFGVKRFRTFGMMKFLKNHFKD